MNRNNLVDNICKFNAYREIASNYNAARDIMCSKKLAYGESAVVPFYYPDRTAENKRIELMLGIGGIRDNVTIFSNILGSETYADDAQVYIEDMGGYQSIQNAFDYILSTRHDSSVYDALVGIKDSIDSLRLTLAEKLDNIALHQQINEEENP